MMFSTDSKFFGSPKGPPPPFRAEATGTNYVHSVQVRALTWLHRTVTHVYSLLVAAVCDLRYTVGKVHAVLQLSVCFRW